MRQVVVMFAALVLGLSAATALLAQYAPPPLQPAEPLKAVPALNSVPAQAPAQPLKAVPPLKPANTPRDPHTPPYCTGDDAKLCAPCVKKCGQDICALWKMSCNKNGVPRFLNPDGSVFDHAGMIRADYHVCAFKCSDSVIGPPPEYQGETPAEAEYNACIPDTVHKMKDGTMGCDEKDKVRKIDNQYWRGTHPGKPNARCRCQPGDPS
jgi:hypothetical protein